MFLDSSSTQIGHGDTWREIGEILGRYDDGIAIRQVDWGIGNQYIRAVAEASRTPVLNMQCDLYHPFQALADLLTVIEQKGDPRKLTFNMSYAYAASYQKPISVPQSVILLMTRYGANVRLTRPPEFKLMPEIVAQAEENAKNAHGSFEIVEDFEEGMRGADVVYAKAWGSMPRWLSTRMPARAMSSGRTPSSSPIWRTSTFCPLKANADVREQLGLNELPSARLA